MEPDVCAVYCPSWHAPWQFWFVRWWKIVHSEPKLLSDIGVTQLFILFLLPDYSHPGLYHTRYTAAIRLIWAQQVNVAFCGFKQCFQKSTTSFCPNRDGETSRNHREYSADLKPWLGPPVRGDPGGHQPRKGGEMRWILIHHILFLFYNMHISKIAKWRMTMSFVMVFPWNGQVFSCMSRCHICHIRENYRTVYGCRMDFYHYRHCATLCMWFDPSVLCTYTNLRND